MTREEAKKILLESVEKEIRVHGEDAVALMSPRVGKDHWTYKEYKEAVENDTDLAEMKDSNPIDTYLRYVAWKEKRDNKG
jgi:hypothetical protein